jgi:predicted phosphodiesterase
MEKFAFIQLCDLHISINKEIDENKIKSILNIIRQELKTSESVFIVVSGDISYSGKREEFDKIKTFFDKIKSLSNTKIYILMCPGNHDSNILDVKDERKEIVDSIIKSKSFNEEDAKFLISHQKSYYEFCEIYNGEIENINSFVQRKTVTIKDLKISFDIVNSAWMTTIPCNPGTIFLPTNYHRCKNSHLRILLMHHSANWLLPEQQREFRNKILDSYSFIFTGHEHETGRYSISTIENKNKTIIVEGGELSPIVDKKNSEFNMLYYDFRNEKYNINKYKYCDDDKIYKSQIEIKEYISYPYFKNINKLGLELKKKFQDFLLDPGAPYRHPNVQTITLDNIYIHPDVKKISNGVGKTKNKFSTSFGNILSTNKGKINLLVGAEKSGKTSLCRYIFKNKMNNECLPVIINGEKLKKFDADEIERELSNAYGSQYESPSKDFFIQFNDDKKVIIIDNFHLSPSTIEDKILILKNLNSSYDDVFVFVDDSFMFQDILRHDEKGVSISDKIIRYNILPFGHKLRNSLIEKWYEIGLDNGKNSLYYSKIDKASSILNVLVKNNFVPPYPFYLYTAISAFEATTPANISESTYGYYYTTLLTMCLGKISNLNEEIDLRKNYLTDFAYKLFSQQCSFISFLEMEKFHDTYCTEYSVNINFIKIKNELIISSILDEDHEKIYFRYKYFYYYFLARHLQINIDTDDTKLIVNKLCCSLHIESSANIVMFLTHLCKNPFIIESIVKHSKQIFSKVSPLKLEDDAHIVNSLACLDGATYAYKEIDEFRQERLEDDDIFDPVEDESEYYSGSNISHACDKDLNEGPEGLILSLTATFKTLEIIGQILKNYYGSLKATQKMMLCEEGYELPLRALADYFHFLSEKKDIFINEVKEYLLDEQKMSLSEAGILEYSKRIIFNLTRMLCFSFVNKAAMSLGNENLSLTYESILIKNNDVAHKLLDISIKLGYNNGVPIEQIKQISADLKKNHIAYGVLCDVVAYHMYMYPLDYKTRQQLCSVLDISFQDQKINKEVGRAHGMHMIG